MLGFCIEVMDWLYFGTFLAKTSPKMVAPQILAFLVPSSTMTYV
jgi:hypothetical protein